MSKKKSEIEKHHIAVYAESKLHEAIKLLAAENRRTMSCQVLVIVEEYLKEKGK